MRKNILTQEKLLEIIINYKENILNIYNVIEYKPYAS